MENVETMENVANVVAETAETSCGNGTAIKIAIAVGGALVAAAAGYFGKKVWEKKKAGKGHVTAKDESVDNVVEASVVE